MSVLDQFLSTKGERDNPSSEAHERELLRWGAIAGLGGGVLLIGSAIVVGAWGLPDASDVETLTDFADIEAARVAEHFLYLGALVLFALHAVVLHRLLRPAHRAAALFGTVVAGLGYTIMAASSLLHVSTAPLADLYTDPDSSIEDQKAIEFAWHGAQSVFDTMLATGVLLVPIAIIFFGVAMRRTTKFGPAVTALTFVLGIVGTVGAAIAVISPGSMFSAMAVVAIVLFHLTTGWRTLTLADEATIDLTVPHPTDQRAGR